MHCERLGNRRDDDDVVLMRFEIRLDELVVVEQSYLRENE